MPTLDWVNKGKTLEATRAVPVHLLKQETAFGTRTQATTCWR